VSSQKPGQSTISHHGKAHEKIKVRRTDDNPLNEFGDNDNLYLSLFPHLFPFGKGMPHKGTLPEKFSQHLLRQRSCTFAHDSRFLFTAFNQKQRHAATRAVRSLASGKPEHLKQLGELCQDLEFRAKVEAAVKDSSSKEAAEVLKILNPLIRTSGGKIDYSASARAAGLTTLYSYTQFFGCPSVFFTIAPDDTHSVLAIRLSIPTKSNQGFPARDEGLLNHLLEGAQTHDLCKIDISEFGLQKLMAENPVAAAEIFMQIQLAIYTILLGISPEKSSKKTRPLGVFRGIFGNCKAVFSVVETQGRLSLHVHMAVWAGLPPHLLQKAAAFPEFVEEIAEVLNQHFQGQLPDGYHVQALHRLATEPKQRPKQDPPRMCYVPCPIPDETPAGGEAFVHHFRTTMNRVGIHAHSSTCEKGGSGKEGCRLAFPRAFCNQTGPVQLIPLEKLEFQVLNDVIREHQWSEISWKIP